MKHIIFDIDLTLVNSIYLEELKRNTDYWTESYKYTLYDGIIIKGKILNSI